MVNFDVAIEEAEVIVNIAKRAVAMARELDVETDQLNIEMDLVACHANGCRLQLQKLLDADDANFSHDVFGIQRYINRSTGKLGGHFVPRYAARQ